jgi:HK97 family phage prohead protease
MNEFYLTKDITEDAIKDVDPVKGIVTGYFSIFGNKDTDGDIVMPGAYKKTIRENGPDSEKPRILHLYMHDSYKVLAKPNVLKEDKKGLYFESKISQTTLGKDVIQLYQDKVLTEHSIGYQIVKREVDEQREEQKLIELKLWEGSTVSWGSNMDALVETVKGEGIQDKKLWDRMVDMMEKLDKALQGNYSDDTARQLEIHFKQLQQVIMSLARKAEPVITPAPEEPKIDADWVMTKLNLKFIK